MSKRSLKYVFLAAPFLLGACGEGYELVRINDAFPYGNERTAGTGVAYVLAKMMPERELNLEPVSTPATEAEPVVIDPEPPPPPQPVQETKDILQDLETQMDKLFEEGQQK